MTKKQIAERAVEKLKKYYPQAVCSLEAENPFHLLVATRLSAQCTDARVNLVTPSLFSKYPDVYAMAGASVDEVEDIIRPCGFFHTKARNIIDMAQQIIDRFNGEVPSTIDELVTLPGVGRKTANLIAGDVFGQSAVVCDTHLIRISGRLGIADTKDPLKVEIQLRKILPPEESNDFCHRCVMYGREICKARKPLCGICVMADICRSAKKDN